MRAELPMGLAGKEAVRPDTAFQAYEISRTEGYRLIQRGEWPSIRIGRTLRIPVADLKQWAEAKRAVGGAGDGDLPDAA